MEVSANWKKYVEVNAGEMLAKIVLSVLVGYYLYSYYKVHFWQVAKADTDTTHGERNRGSRSKGARKNQKSRGIKKAIPPRRRNQTIHQERRITEVIALDCEMVGIQDGKESMLARVSVVNSHGHPLYDTFVKPTEPVVDYRTAVSGVRAIDLENGVEFPVAQKAVADLLKGRILVGHALRNDFRVLYLSHPRRKIRDTSRYGPFREITNGRTPSLKKLANEILGVNLQEGEHSSVEDAKAAMQLYNLYKRKWESGQV